MKLRPRILTLVIGILIVSFMALSIPLYWYTHSALENELDKRLRSTAQLAARNISGDLLLNLTKEPALAAVRFALEQELASFMVEGIEGLAIYSQQGAELAKWSLRKSDHPRISVLLQTFSGVEDSAISAVSEIYQLSKGDYVKAAATSS